MAANRLVLDACVLINLCATRRLASIATELNVSLVITREVAAETLYVLEGGDGEALRSRIHIEELVEHETIEVVDLDDASLPTFVSLAARLDDGEASTVALAVRHGLPLATDDRAALRLIDAEYPTLEVLSSAQVMRQYCERAGLSRHESRSLLNAIANHASYVPSLRDPEGSWWRSVSAQEGTTG